MGNMLARAVIVIVSALLLLTAAVIGADIAAQRPVEAMVDLPGNEWIGPTLSNPAIRQRAYNRLGGPGACLSPTPDPRPLWSRTRSEIEMEACAWSVAQSAGSAEAFMALLRRDGFRVTSPAMRVPTREATERHDAAIDAVRKAQMDLSDGMPDYDRLERTYRATLTDRVTVQRTEASISWDDYRKIAGLGRLEYGPWPPYGLTIIVLWDDASEKPREIRLESTRL